ncbi:MAG TPA: hypothetical protein VFG23_26855 [Polyangia bacterium]|nr:hypothetical protein [Polyangia bacterium]
MKSIGENLWIADGPIVYAYGFPFPTRMAVVRLEDGRLWLWSPVRLDDGLRRDISDLGRPTYAVTPNKLHHLALRQWVDAFPELSLYAPPGLARKRPDLRFSAELEDASPAAWRDEIDQVRIEGSIFMTEVFFFHRRSRTCLVGDLVQRHGDDGKTWKAWLVKLGGVGGPEGGTPRDARLTFWHRRRARACIERALAWAPERLVIAHGPCVLEDGTSALRRSMSWLLD